MKADYSNNERFTDVEEQSDAPVQRTHRLLFGRRVHRGTLLIVLMFVLGAGWVFWESRMVGPKIAAADSVATDPNITMNLDQMQMEAVIGTTRDARQQQLFGPLLKDVERRRIRLHSPRRDPFEAPTKKETPAPVLAAQPTTAPVVETPPGVVGLELRSILIGASPTAIINGYLVQEGQVIAEWKVVQILPEKVVLQWRKHQHVLTMP